MMETMKLNNSYFVLPLFAAYCWLGVTSCQKELNALPENAKVDGNTILDAPTARTALNGVYYRFANVNASSNTTTWQVNERLPGQLSGYLTYGYGSGASSPESNYMPGSAATYWTYAYQIINAANTLIHGIGQLPENRIPADERNHILGETRFLRAYGHFKLLSYYAQWFDANSPYGVLIREEPMALGSIAKARSSVAESYDFILADLDYAIENAPDTNKTIYATRWAAMALKMRVLMCRGTAEDHAMVISLADGLIGQSGYSLEPLAKDIFRTKGLTSSEVILGITPQPNQVEYYYNRSRQFWPGASSLYCAAAALPELLEDDPRQAWMVGSFRPTYANYFFTKFIAEGSTPTEVSETSYALRLTEVYLLKAEALLRSGGSLDAAKMILKEIGQHNGLTEFSDLNAVSDREELLEYTFYETIKCLLSEDGQEWLALLRLPLAKVQELRPSIIDNVQYILPVPTTEFRHNASFGEQNPGYPKEF